MLRSFDYARDDNQRGKGKGNRKCHYRVRGVVGFEGALLLGWGRLGCGGWEVGEDRAVGAGAGHEDGQADRGQHEDDGRPGGEAGEEIGGTAGAEGGLRTGAAEGTGEVGGLALLKQDYADEEEADDDVQDDEQDEHGLGMAFKGAASGEMLDWCGGGDLNPYALRR